MMLCKQLNKGQNGGSMQAYIVPVLNKIFEYLARIFLYNMSNLNYILYALTYQLFFSVELIPGA